MIGYLLLSVFFDIDYLIFLLCIWIVELDYNIEFIELKLILKKLIKYNYIWNLKGIILGY